MPGYAPLVPAVAVLPDRRWRQRLQVGVHTLDQQPQRSLPQATGNRNDMDAAYQFFKNPRVRPQGVLVTCRPGVLHGLGDCRRVLALQDGCDFNFGGLKDTDGNGKADERRVVLRGFGTGDAHQNLNSFFWGPGGELMFSQGLHAFSRVETPWGIERLDHAGIWRWRPRRRSRRYRRCARA